MALGQPSYRRVRALSAPARTNAILGLALTGPRLALGHAWQCPC